MKLFHKVVRLAQCHGHYLQHGNPSQISQILILDCYRINMFTRYDKAAAGALSAALLGVLAALTDLPPESLGAVGTLLTPALVALVPNKQ